MIANLKTAGSLSVSKKRRALRIPLHLRVSQLFFFPLNFSLDKCIALRYTKIMEKQNNQKKEEEKMVTKLNGKTMVVVEMNLNKSVEVFAPDAGKNLMCDVCGKKLEYGDTDESGLVDDNGIPCETVWVSCPVYMERKNKVSDEHTSLLAVRLI